MELFNEFISVLITILAVIYTFSTLAKSAARAGRKKGAPDSDDLDLFEEEEEQEDEKGFEEFVLKQENIKQEPIKPKAYTPPLPPPAPKIDKAQKQEAIGEFSFHSKLDDYTQKTSIEDRELEIHLRPASDLCSDAFRLAQSEGAVMKRPVKPSIKQLIKSLPEEQLLFLSYEVFHVPVSKRSSPFPWNG